MVNRRFLREKVLENLYSFWQQNDMNIVIIENNMIFGIKKLYELYGIFQCFFVKLSETAAERAEIEAKKQFPSKKSEDGHRAFAENKYLAKLKEDQNYQNLIEEFQISWNNDQDIVADFYQEVFESSHFKIFMETDQTFSDAQTFLYTIIKRKFAGNSKIAHFLKERSVFWAVNYNAVLYWFQKEIKDKDENSISYSVDYDTFVNPLDLEFASNLLIETVSKADEADALIQKNLKEWSFDRTLLIEIVIMRMGITEIKYFRTIPFKVSINESIELVKKYSDDAHKSYINGIFNSIVENG
jgi:N utilization substance protein B